VDRQGRVVYISELAEYILECRDKMVIGTYVPNLFHSMEKEILNAALENGEHIFKYVTGPRNKRILVNIEPVQVEHELCGAILSIQKWKEPQNSMPADSPEVTDNKAKGRFDDYACRTELFRTLIKKAKFAAYTDAPVLFYGDEGTETRGLANSLHNESHRHKMNFVEVECSAWDSEKINEMLFGLQRLKEGEVHTKTVIEIAEGGTIFLNHIDALSQELQFRVYCLIKGQYTLNSDPHQIKANVRVLAATDKDLRKMVSEGAFRRDLYYALNVISFKIPPLRERKADIRDIVDLFVAHYENKYAKPVRLADGVYECICAYDWPGNTRQLEYYCQKLMLTASSRNISEAFAREVLKDLGQDAAGGWEKKSDSTPVSDEARQIIEVLKRNRGSKTQTASDLGISKATLWRRMQKYGITTDYSL
jgi:transcriptional regulator with PAS, ATPase and Fis domain